MRPLCVSELHLIRLCRTEPVAPAPPCADLVVVASRRKCTLVMRLAVGDSIMTTINHNVNRVTSAGSSEELAESHVNKTTRLATEDSEQP
jgi:hypothetical protein